MPLPQSAPQTVDPQGLLTDPARRKAASATALKLFLRLTDRWGISGAQQTALLGDLPRSTFQRWRSRVEAGKAIELTRDQMERVSLCLGIEKALKLIMADDAAQTRWLKSSNRDAPFAGASPAETMAQDGIMGLYSTRRYLDAWRGVR